MPIAPGLGAALGGLFGGGAALLGASQAAKAQKRASDAATALQLEYLDWQKQMYGEDVARRKPFYDLSLLSLPELQKFISGDFDITTTPEYQTQSKALDRQLSSNLAARGLQQSGFGVEEDARLKTGLMSDLYNKRFSRLAALANLGSMGMAQAPNLGDAYSNLANLAMQRGQGQAQAYSAMGQIPMNMFNAYSMWNFLNRQPSGLGMTPEMTAWDLF